MSRSTRWPLRSGAAALAVLLLDSTMAGAFNVAHELPSVAAHLPEVTLRGGGERTFMGVSTCP